MNLLTFLRPDPAVIADIAAYESEVRHRIAERESERIRQQIDAERAWLSDDVPTSDFLAEYLPGVAA